MKKTGMRLTVYLPDDIAQEAKAAEINLSRTLRQGVEDQLRGDTSPSVDLRRVGRMVEITIVLPVETLRGLIQ